ncbi:hypothetical protein JMJ35_004644 [Cladonia borealis]|uniref:F-box domain-containing protein n=1 Tax=Cladonia borealis TaxID=184061 RepID=A0AA39R0F3_9LECA|nr:hypothetical protein JMJ35_004644 [Cladonia borealis]
MPHILNLANEVLYQIIAATNPHDIESLAASCKTINILAQPELKRHRELKKSVHPIYVLRDILQDTALAQYPTTLQIGPFDEYYHDWLSNDHDKVESEGIRTVAAECDREIQNAIYQCPFIETPEREIWRVQIMEGRGQAIIGLLLTLLPNLTSMTTVPKPEEGLFTQILKRIVEFQQPTHRLAPQALTKLARIDARPFYYVSLMTVHEFDHLSQYALLPSMRTITGSHFETYVSGNARTFQWPHDPGISAVTEINIDRSMVDGESITNLVRSVRALERFSFSFGEHLPTRVIYQPRKIIRGLELYTKSSLSYLHLTGTRIRINTTQDDDLEIDLRVFEKLKQLRIDHTLLSHHGRPCLAPFKGKPDQDCNCWPQRLVDVLPASLESLEVMDYVPWKHARAFFAGFPEFKAERLPRLRDIEMQGSAAVDLQFIHLCESVGVILSQDGVEDDVNYHYS